MKDKYQIAVEYLTEHPGQIDAAWDNPWVAPGGCLFLYCTPDGECRTRDFQPCGCLTQIRYGHCIAWTPSLTEAIRSDESIPKISTDIRVEHLETFASWQRRLDKELNRA